jgi:hypothetical protein
MNEKAPDPTIPAGMRIQFWGFPEDVANSVGRTISGILTEYSRYLPLENLDGVTVGADYHDALSQVDRGCPEINHSPRPTEDPIVGTGVGMALPVNRSGILKTHLVFGPIIIQRLANDPTSDEFREGVEIIAHELGHAYDHEMKYQAFGNYAFRKIDEYIPDRLQQYLWELSNHTWDEYCANRIAGILISRARHEPELFQTARDTYRQRIQTFRTKYHWHIITLENFLDEVAHNLRLALLATGYALGIQDALTAYNEPDPALQSLLNDPESAELLAFHPPLLKIWDRRGEWTTYDEIVQLNQPTLALLHSLHLFPSLTKEGNLYMNVPVRL